MQLKVLIGTGVEGRAERVEHALLRARALDHGIHEGRLELRLGEHARRVELFEPLVDLAKPLRARSHRGVDGDRADGVHPVAVLEILIGIVEHDVRTIGNGREPVSERTVELVQPLAQTLGIGLVDRSIARVCVAERGRDRGREHLGVAGIEPDVHVGLAVRMVRGLVLGIGVLAFVLMLPRRARLRRDRHRRRHAHRRARALPTCRLRASEGGSGRAPATAR